MSIYPVCFVFSISFLYLFEKRLKDEYTKDWTEAKENEDEKWGGCHSHIHKNNTLELKWINLNQKLKSNIRRE